MEPFVSIIVLNYNGERFLRHCLGSLERLAYPRDRYEVIVVDNASVDEPLALIREEFPWVRLITNKVNIGFSRGNNVAIREAKGEFLVLLNNDTHVMPDWLSPLVAAAERDPRIGLCASKICLLDRRVDIELSCRPFRPVALGLSEDGRDLGVCVASAKLIGGAGNIEFLDGFHSQELRDGRTVRWTTGCARLGISISGHEEEVVLEIVFVPGRPPEAGPVHLEIRLVDGGEPLLRVPGSDGGLPEACRVVLRKELLATARPVIQNAGSLVFADGSGRDRGAIVRGTHQHYELDVGQYETLEEVFGACGASMLMRRRMLEDVGLFDESFFMYYEDTDLSWRARLRGWKVVYVPESVVWHAHCGTSVEWSPFFVFHTDRNRLAMLLKNGTLAQTCAAWGEYVRGTFLGCVAVLVKRLLLAQPVDLERRVLLKLRVIASLIGALPFLLRARRTIQRRRCVAQDEIARWFQPR